MSLLTWESEGFAFADGFDEATSRYRGLRAGQPAPAGLDGESSALLVRSDDFHVRRYRERRESTKATWFGGGLCHPAQHLRFPAILQCARLEAEHHGFWGSPKAFRRSAGEIP